ncbi:hypothetical protein M0R45_031471 [Rubus argutus]|uniref:Uncharacterized protein n=1 Tax=Rubus argutus TaxID=59490 RepID=A0AAW1WGG4_RUBAR
MEAAIQVEQRPDKEAVQPEEEHSGNGIRKPPLIEEITIPSVTDLSKSGVKFLPANGSISCVSFDAKPSHVTSRLLVPFLDNVIEDANKYYNGRWKIKMRGILQDLCVWFLAISGFARCHFARALEDVASILLSIQLQSHISYRFSRKLQ